MIRCLWATLHRLHWPWKVPFPWGMCIIKCSWYYHYSRLVHFLLIYFQQNLKIIITIAQTKNLNFVVKFVFFGYKKAPKRYKLFFFMFQMPNHFEYCTQVDFAIKCSKIYFNPNWRQVSFDFSRFCNTKKKLANGIKWNWSVFIIRFWNFQWTQCQQSITQLMHLYRIIA